MNKLEVGQKLYRVYFDKRRSPGDYVTVTKVGRVYAELDGCTTRRIRISDLKEDAVVYYARYRCYVSKDDYDAEVERNRILRLVRDYFSQYGKNELSIEKLRQIAELAGIDVAQREPEA